MSWSQSLNGRAIDLVEPKVEQVDFKEIAEMLAGTYRYAGASYYDISVALHTLIVFDAAQDFAKPYALLHDAHETRTSEVTRPAQVALAQFGAKAQGSIGYNAVRDAFILMKLAHDRVIWCAAGLPPPTETVRKAVHDADLVALATERRDFLMACDRPWDRALEAVAPLQQTYKWRNKWTVADELYRKFKQYLPALQMREAAMPLHHHGTDWRRMQP